MNTNYLYLKNFFIFYSLYYFNNIEDKDNIYFKYLLNIDKFLVKKHDKYDLNTISNFIHIFICKFLNLKNFYIHYTVFKINICKKLIYLNNLCNFNLDCNSLYKLLQEKDYLKKNIFKKELLKKNFDETTVN